MKERILFAIEKISFFYEGVNRLMNKSTRISYVSLLFFSSVRNMKKISPLISKKYFYAFVMISFN